MNRLVAVKIVLLLGGIGLLPQAYSHPYDSPLEFRKHKTNDGRVIYSNIPKKCFAEGRLRCLNLHPVFAVDQQEQPPEKNIPQK